MASPTRWRPVSRREPCPKCGHADNCKISEGADGGLFVYCGRIAEGSIGEPNAGNQHLHMIGVEQRKSAPVQRELEQPKPGADLTALSKHHTRCLTAERLTWLSQNLGVPEASLTAIGVGFDLTLSAFTFPEWDHAGRVIGFLNRFADGSKKQATGGSRGLTIPGDWLDRQGPLYLPEGASGTAAVHALGASVVGRPNNIGGVEFLVDLLIDFPADRQIVVIADYDRKQHEDLKPRVREQHDQNCECCGACFPGRYGAISTTQKLANALDRPVAWSHPPDGFKDSREWYKHA